MSLLHVPRDASTSGALVGALQTIAARWSTSRSSSLPNDVVRAAKNARFPKSSRPAREGDEKAPGDATEDVVDVEVARLHKEQQDVVSNFMFPWERRQMQGGKLSTWEQWYWGVFVLAIAVFLFNRAGSWNSEVDIEKVEEERRRKEAMDRLKLERARLIMTGGSVLVPDEEDDPFEGMAPEEVMRFVEENTGGSTKDPFAGMTPEEIDDYVRKHHNGM
jgi:hypothetical protein